MKLLLEEYGQSDTLDDFVYMASKVYSSYYQVILKQAGKYEQDQINYFMDKESAKDYYDKVYEEIKDDENFDAAVLSLERVEVNRDVEEEESVVLDIEE